MMIDVRAPLRVLDEQEPTRVAIAAYHMLYVVILYLPLLKVSRSAFVDIEWKDTVAMSDNPTSEPNQTSSVRSPVLSVDCVTDLGTILDIWQ